MRKGIGRFMNKQEEWVWNLPDQEFRERFLKIFPDLKTREQVALRLLELQAMYPEDLPITKRMLEERLRRGF